MSREQAEDLLAGDMRSGAFLVRIKVPNQQWALSMVWQGMFVHHLISQAHDSGAFYINDQPFPHPVGTLDELVEYLRVCQSDNFRVIEQDLRHVVSPKK